MAMFWGRGPCVAGIRAVLMVPGSMAAAARVSQLAAIVVKMSRRFMYGKSALRGGYF